MWQEYYEQQLYPLQNSVLRVISSADTPFYLTGGTALSRMYLQHRYSDDLDLFVNQNETFRQHTATILKALQQNFSSVELSITYDTFARLYVKEYVENKEVILKIEFVNDVLFHVGDTTKHPLFLRIDNIDNILSNKICALNRDEAKDWADIWQIALAYPFSWKEAIENAKKKDMWVDEAEVLIKLETFDLSKLEEVRWIKPLSLAQAQRDREVLLKDVLLGANNSLCKT